MSETEPIVPFRPRASGAVAANLTARTASDIAFDRRELSMILTIYGHQVSQGEWRDYAIDHGREKAVFSIFRRASERPLYRIEKHPRLERRQGLYAVIAEGGMILRRGHDLAQVLRVLMRGPRLVSG